MTACTPLLQKPHRTSKTRDHVKALDRRLRAWKAGDVDGLMREGRAIPNHIPQSHYTNHDLHERNTFIFSKLVL